MLSTKDLWRPRRDPDAGTDFGVYVTCDGGATWVSLSTTLPTAPVLDLAFQERETDLVAATHGRGIFVLDVATVTPK